MTSREVALAPVTTASALGRWLADRIIPVIHSFRGRHLFVIDLALIVLSIYLALVMRGIDPVGAALSSAYGPLLLLPLVVRPAVNDRFGLCRRLWSHASVPELTQILYAITLGSVISIVMAAALFRVTGWASTELGPSFWILEFVFSLALIGGTRFLLRALSEVGTRAVVGGTTISLTPALLYGAGRAGAMMARSAIREPAAGVKPVGFLDSDLAKRGSTVAGLPVFGGLDQLEDAVRRSGARMLLITLPNPSGQMIRRIMDHAIEAGLQVRTVPPVHGLFDGSWNAHRVRDIQVEDLLTREQVTTHAPEVAESIRDQVVMVTGAGGSIGSELARQVYAFRPKKLVLVDRAESPLYMIQRELELRRMDGRGAGELSVNIANVASRAVMKRLIATTRPAVIFHAAACKHVPMMEEHPSEGVQVNVGGTMSLLSAIRERGVDRLVFSSSAAVYGQGGRGPLETIPEAAPKAPASPYGDTKLACEWMIAAECRAYGLSAVALRYFNAAGADPSGQIGEAHEPETHLIPLAIAAAIGRGPALTVFGTDYDTPDGTCLRDYIHVNDLAAAHVAALNVELPAGRFEAANVGVGQGRSVLQVVEAVARAVGRPVPHAIGARRAGDPASLVADPDYARELLGWSAQCSDLDRIVADALRWEAQPVYSTGGRAAGPTARTEPQ